MYISTIDFCFSIFPCFTQDMFVVYISCLVLGKCQAYSAMDQSCVTQLFHLDNGWYVMHAGYTLLGDLPMVY